LWNVAESGDADDAMFIYSVLEMTGSKWYIVNVLESGDADDSMSIYSALEISVGKLWNVECAREW
jgi:hypothetical protein